MVKSLIIGTGSYLPVHTLSNDDLAKTVDTNDQWIYQRTGIKNRHIAAETELTSDLATHALNNAIISAGISADDLDAIVLATTTPDLIFPATGVKVQHNIGMKHGFAFDVQAVCSGFIYALYLANIMIISGNVKKVAVVGAEIMSRIVNWKDRSTCVLFGDGAGAVILSAATNLERRGILDAKLYSDGSLTDILKVNGGIAKGNLNAKIEMKGGEVFKRAVERMSAMVVDLAHSHGYILADLDWILPHQASSRILDAMAEKLKIPLRKVMSTICNHANTGAATIPLTLDHYVKTGQVKDGDLIALTAVGGGLTAACALLKL
ncbi:3-oxoacyl-(acyl carrier protein) synthase 3 [Alphaproteobacteria bacterium]